MECELEWVNVLWDTYVLQNFMQNINRNNMLFYNYFSLAGIGHMPDSITLLQLLDWFFFANLGFCYSNLTGITKFRYERKKEMNPGLRGCFHGGGGAR